MLICVLIYKVYLIIYRHNISTVYTCVCECVVYMYVIICVRYIFHDGLLVRN